MAWFPGRGVLLGLVLGFCLGWLGWGSPLGAWGWHWRLAEGVDVQGMGWGAGGA